MHILLWWLYFAMPHQIASGTEYCILTVQSYLLHLLWSIGGGWLGSLRKEEGETCTELKTRSVEVWTIRTFGPRKLLNNFVKLFSVTMWQ